RRASSGSLGVWRQRLPIPKRRRIWIGLMAHLRRILALAMAVELCALLALKARQSSVQVTRRRRSARRLPTAFLAARGMSDASTVQRVAANQPVRVSDLLLLQHRICAEELALLYPVPDGV